MLLASSLKQLVLNFRKPNHRPRKPLNMNHALTIPKKQSEAYGKDYHWLRQQGIAHIEALSGNLWTDYNTHDPGITILELLCYVLTDLGFRIAKPISEIVASPDNPLEE